MVRHLDQEYAQEDGTVVVHLHLTSATGKDSVVDIQLDDIGLIYFACLGRATAEAMQRRVDRLTRSLRGG
jgi:hypothetical protein